MIELMTILLMRNIVGFVMENGDEDLITLININNN